MNRRPNRAITAPLHTSAPADGETAFVFRELASASAWLARAQRSILQQQITLAAVPAPTGHESARATVYAEMLRESGVSSVRIDRTGNVIARVRVGGAHVGRVQVGDVAGDDTRDEIAPVVVLAHLDTVYSSASPLPHAVRHEGARVCAPGIGDNSRGLAAMSALAAALQGADVRRLCRRPIELVATVGEEGDGNLRGARGYFDDRAATGRLAPAAVVALDGPGDSLIVHHGIASQRLRFTYRGMGGHPWAEPHAPNAIHVAGDAMSSISRFAAVQPAGTTVHITRMGGGESLTAIAREAWFDVDVRTLDPSSLPRVVHAIRRLADTASSSHGVARMTLSVQLLGDRPGGVLDAAHPLVRIASEATLWQGGDPRAASASTDANIALSRGIPAIAIGAGGTGGGAHTDDEWYDDTGSTRGVARALGIVVAASARVHPLT